MNLGADPAECRNVAEDHPKTLKSMGVTLDAYLAALPEDADPSPRRSRGRGRQGWGNSDR